MPPDHALTSPKRLLIFDIYENCAYELETELKNKYGADAPIITLIGSIRDKARLDEVFETYHPSVVFHAAAHKHVPLMEISPAEAVKNNVFGTKNLLTSAAEHGVERFVQLSTDKAVNPTNVMGCTKRLCEMLIQTFCSRYNDDTVWPSASATCWAATAALSHCLRSKSSAAARSPSPTRTLCATL